jgi:hypothetical protein
MRSWQEEQEPETLAFLSEIKRLCDDQKEASLQQQSCRSLLLEDALLAKKLVQAS